MIHEPTQAHILIVDDDDLVCQTLVRLLGAARFKHIEIATSGQQALNKLMDKPFDLCILDLVMPNMSGLEVINEIQKRNISIDIIVLTGEATTERVVQVIKGGAQEVLEKPINPQTLLAVIRRVLEQHHPLPHILAEKWIGTCRSI